MKTLINCFFLILLGSIFSCGKDCTPPTIEENLVGKWNAKISFSGITQSGDVIFNSDHTGTSPGEIFQDTDNNGNVVMDFTWKIEGDSTLFIKHASNSLSLGHKILKNECATIRMDYLFADCILYRK